MSPIRISPISAKIVDRASGHLFSIETCRQHLEVVPIDSDGHPDDSLILSQLDAAVGNAEKFTGRSIMLRTWEFALDDFPRIWCISRRVLQPGIEIPRPPLIEVVSFTFSDDSDGELEQDVDYLIDDYGDKAVLRPTSTWPILSAPYPNRVRCRFRAGYQSEDDPDSDAEPLPSDIRAAILLTLAHLYENREASTEKAMTELPFGVEAFLRPWRVLTGMA